MTQLTQNIRLQQDNHQKICVSIPQDQAEQAIKSAMNYRNTGSHPSYLKRLYSEGSRNFDLCVEKLHTRFPA